MICAELEKLVTEMDRIRLSLEDPDLKAQDRRALQLAYDEALQKICDHRQFGHGGKSCGEAEAA